MRRVQKLVLLSRLSSDLEGRGSWVGETHLQKAVFLLQTLTQLPTNYPFILYNYGPFSFELREELNRMRGEGLLDLVSQPYPYGPSFRSTAPAKELERRFPRTLSQFERELEFVEDLVGDRSAGELERLATAAYLIDKDTSADSADLAKRLHDLKPQISVDQALRAVEEIRAIADKAPRVTA